MEFDTREINKELFPGLYRVCLIYPAELWFQSIKTLTRIGGNESYFSGISAPPVASPGKSLDYGPGVARPFVRALASVHTAFEDAHAGGA